MQNNAERAKDLLPAIILTILSMIQALALELFWSQDTGQRVSLAGRDGRHRRLVTTVYLPRKSVENSQTGVVRGVFTSVSGHRGVIFGNSTPILTGQALTT